MSFKVLSIFIFGVWTITFYSQTPANSPLTPELETNWEEWVNNRPVAGSLRVGVMIDGEETLDRPEALYIKKPALDLPYICVQIKSVDGRYRAHLTYPTDQTNRGIIKLDFPSKHKKELSKYRSDELSILAELKEDCFGPAQQYLVAGWDPNFQDKPIVLYVNSRRPVKLIAVRDRQIIEQFPCVRFESRNKATVSYNKKCRFRIDQFDSQTSLILRQSGSGPVSSPKDYTVPIHMQ